MAYIYSYAPLRIKNNEINIRFTKRLNSGCFVIILPMSVLNTENKPIKTVILLKTFEFCFFFSSVLTFDYTFVCVCGGGGYNSIEKLRNNENNLELQLI